MCGFVGYIEKENNDFLEKMLKSIDYRGPDDSGTYRHVNDNIFVNLGHVRLSILDTSSLGHQPIISDCNDIIMVYNGEVYNFKDIQKELIKLGYIFKSNSDTEVILYSYKEWGIKCVDKFIGMFAMSIYDKQKNKMFLIRDRAGVKPLYYFVKDDLILFGSELKTFHSHKRFEKKLNKEVLGYFFQLGYIPAPWTIFENCFKLQPGSYLEYDLKNNQFEIKEYWNLLDSYNQENNDKSEKEILEDLEELLIDSCNLRMVSDVPVGVFLSGGYDSSLVTAILSKHQKQQIKTFTIGFYEKDYNEANHAKTIAEYLGTKHTEYYCTKDDMLDLFDKLPQFFDEPFADSSSIPTILVSQMAEKDVSVVLSADGGDEVFFGYSKYFALDNISKNNLKKYKILVNLFSSKNIAFFNKLLPKKYRQTNIKEKYNKFKNALDSKDNKEMFLNSSSVIASKEVRKLLKPICFKSFEETNFNWFDKLNREDINASMMLTDYRTFMLDDVLTKVDRSTMSVSIEGREPLLDHRLSEFMANISSDLKFKNKKGKYLLREVLYKYLPKELVERPKSGFNIPLASWLRNDLKHIVDKYLSKDRIMESDVFNVAEVEKIKNEFYVKNNMEVANSIWHLLVFEMWKDKWLGND